MSHKAIYKEGEVRLQRKRDARDKLRWERDDKIESQRLDELDRIRRVKEAEE